ncbi:MAG: alpha/beta hydrolase [Gammaproteobacteria bacterium]|jgi:pimeloyl-ACP methyl ester carboxylesterase|nr:alpha/beta hydrolase [Gammaproteobacteria bacterium]
MKIELKTLQLKDGRILGYAEYGDPKGKPIFYFHGFPGSRLEASYFHETALENQYRIIALDRPGMGLSSPYKDRTIISWATDVEEFANALQIERFSVIGHSGGAPFVAACAYKIPDRLIGAAVISGMAPLERPELKASMSFGQKFMNWLISTMPWLSTVMMWLTRMMLKHPDKMMSQMVKKLPEVDQTFFKDMQQRKAIIDSTLEAFKNGVSGPADEMKLLFKPWGFELEKIKYPIKIWHGALDPQSPISHAKVYEKTITGAKLNIVENEGHHSLLRNNIKRILKSIV